MNIARMKIEIVYPGGEEMARSMTRREFLSFEGLLHTWRDITSNTLSESRRRESIEQYFQSPLYSYPLLQEMPWELLLEEADRKGISTDGRSKNDIARDLFSDLQR